MIDKIQRRKNLREFRYKYCRHVKSIMAKDNMTLEELSEQSKIPPKVLENYINGHASFFGFLNYFAGIFNKKLKIRFYD